MIRSRFPRHARKVVVVCLALAATLGALLAFAFTARAAAFTKPGHVHVVDRDFTRRDGALREKDSSTPITLAAEGASVLAFPPRKTAAKRATVIYLHGIHGRAENGCPWFRDGASQIGWLVCPSANARLPNDTFSWAGTAAEQRAVVARAERAAIAAAGGAADAGGANVLVGFSQGAFVALDLVERRLGRTRGLVLIGADVEPSAAGLAAAGVDRVVFAAGELDGAYATMRRAADRLARDRASGVEVRFVSLGKVGHTYATPNKDALNAAIAWSGGA